MRDRITGTLLGLSGLLFIAAVTNPAVVSTFDDSMAEAMAAYGRHPQAWLWSTWLLIVSVVAGLVGIAMLARRIGSEVAFIGLVIYAVGSTLILAGETFEVAVSYPLIGASSLPEWYLGVEPWADGLATAYFALLAPVAMACLGVEILRLRSLPRWTGVVLLVATAALLGQFISFHGALPFPQFLAFVALGVALNVSAARKPTRIREES